MIVPLAQPAPPGLSAALAGLSEVLEHPGRSAVRDRVVLRPVPPPRSLAPWSYAVAADVDRGEESLASGRFVVLHDPAGQPGWDGDTRVVTFVEADVDAEMAADEALAEVAWSWLLEALEQRGAAYAAAGGTVTRTVSARFGDLAETADANLVEVRASWTARPAADGVRLAPHLLAWCDLLASTAGLPPPGVAALQPR